MRATVRLETGGLYPVVGRTFGPWFWIHCAYSYALIAIAIGILVRAVVSAPYFYRRQPTALLVGCLIPLAWNIAFVFAPGIMPSYDFTPATIALAGVVTAWGLFRIRLFNLVPVARHVLVENMPDGMLLLDKSDRVVDLNKSAQALIDRPLGAILAQPLAESWVVWAQTAPAHCAGANQAELHFDENGQQRHYEVKWSPLTRHGRALGRLVAFRDVTDQVLMEESLRHQTLTDGLTGLPNRALFMARLDDAIHQARRSSDALFALMVLDLDRFKLINDSIGHLAGDVLLQSVATKLKCCVREADTVARMGGDEFMILLRITHARDLLPVLDRIQEELRTPVFFRQQEMTTACSVGVVIWNPSYEDPEDLLRAADTAMYQAKEAGRGCHRIFDEEMHKSVMRTLEAETDLRLAMKQQDFSLAYQPIVHLDTGTIRSLEALIRWHHPKRGTVFPDDFIAIAENSGLIVPLGEMVLKEVHGQISRWQSPGNPAAKLPVSLNLSPRQLIEPEFATMVMDHLAEWHIPSDRLIFEITETALIRDPLRSKQVMRDLRGMGIRLCLDDFGTGWSSIQHLTTFPVQELKIDHTFISKIIRGNTDFEVVRSLIALAHTLGLEVTAEGIENSEQWRLLHELGCDAGQGYYIGRPMDPPELLEYLEDLERGSCALRSPGGPLDDRWATMDAPRSHDADAPIWRPQVSLATKRTS
jgi:diguanylate cyclase (GGDEF)-like protein